MGDFLEWTAHDLIAALRGGGLSAADVMQATLARIDAENPHYNAIVSLRDPEVLLQEARAADQADSKGPLHGVPVAVKDLADVGGMPTSQGSPLFAGQIAPESEIMVQRMQDAGAIVIGKTNTPEFGLGSHTYNPVFGATQNALLPGCSAGGSSGGAAVALARHMICLADGSDAMGSLRNPAGWNGVYGMRPTWGRLPGAPAGDLFMHQLATNGPMARTPRDLALLLGVQSGPDPRVAFGLPKADYTDALDGDVAGRKIAWLADWGGAYPMEEGVLAAAQAGVARFEELGCTVEAIAPPFDAAALWEAWTVLRAWYQAAKFGAIYDDTQRRDLLKPEAVWEVEKGRALTGTAIQQASTLRSDWYRAAQGLFDRYDAFVLPTAQCWPFPVDWDWPKQIGGLQMDTYHRWMEVVIPVSLIGLPCVAVPMAGARPMGLQIAGRRGDDLGVLQLGEAWHRVTS
ncbi:amidase [Yoonia sp. R78084]|uniref:amidase n=1 Tax=Yoonia sp. R78084 TaxID=3093869 RepID=UPI0037DD94F8